MSPQIHAPKADALARELATATGEDIDTAVVRAIEERLARPPRRRPADEKPRSKLFSTVWLNCPFSINGLPKRSSAMARRPAFEVKPPQVYQGSIFDWCPH